jgi:hypothetical protein
MPFLTVSTLCSVDAFCAGAVWSLRSLLLSATQRKRSRWKAASNNIAYSYHIAKSKRHTILTRALLILVLLSAIGLALLQLRFLQRPLRHQALQGGIEWG